MLGTDMILFGSIGFKIVYGIVEIGLMYRK